jgi:hypothetical protein
LGTAVVRNDKLKAETEARGSLVVKPLRYKPVAGSRPDEVNFEIYVILPAALGPGVHSAPNRNEYEKQK